MAEVLVVTTNDVPGHQIVAVQGEVFGQTTRARNFVSDIGQGIKSLVGGEIKGYTTLQNDSREEALLRMRESAAKMGANAVVAFRFDSDSGQLGDSVTAYGTAVTINKID